MEGHEARIKKMDLDTALCITSLAGIPTHDSIGNLLASVWCKHTSDMQKEVGSLLETEDLRKILLDQLRRHIEKRQDLLYETEDTKPLVKWIMDFTVAWEEEYRVANYKKYDVSQKVYSAMLEAYNYVKECLSDNHGQKFSQWIKIFETEKEGHFSGEKAAVRSMFRRDSVNPVMCMLAAKIMQKQEVCNRPGAYSSKVQRNDVTEQIHDAKVKVDHEIEMEDSSFLKIISETERNEFTKDFTFHGPHAS